MWFTQVADPVGDRVESNLLSQHGTICVLRRLVGLCSGYSMAGYDRMDLNQPCSYYLLTPPA
jgi:hypothetical protein